MAGPPATIRPASPPDAAPISAIYNHYVTSTVVTFEEAPVSAENMAERIGQITTAGFPWLVVDQGDKVRGYSYATKWHERAAYRHSVETTVYLDPEFVGEGLGTMLYGALIQQLRQQGFHSAIGGIALPNDTSVALHEKLGFQKAAHYREVGFKFGRWIDVAYWDLILTDIPT